MLYKARSIWNVTEWSLNQSTIAWHWVAFSRPDFPVSDLDYWLSIAYCQDYIWYLSIVRALQEKISEWLDSKACRTTIIRLRLIVKHAYILASHNSSAYSLSCCPELVNYQILPCEVSKLALRSPSYDGIRNCTILSLQCSNYQAWSLWSLILKSRDLCHDLGRLQYSSQARKSVMKAVFLPGG